LQKLGRLRGFTDKFPRRWLLKNTPFKTSGEMKTGENAGSISKVGFEDYSMFSAGHQNLAKEIDSYAPLAEHQP